MLNLQVGDDVILEDSDGNMSLVKIDRETPTRLYVRNYVFHKKDGSQVGSSNIYSNRTTLYSVTNERMEKVQEYTALLYRKRLIKAIGNFKLDDLSKEVLEQVYQLIKNNLPKKENNE